MFAIIVISLVLLGYYFYKLFLYSGPPPEYWKEYNIPCINSAVVASNLEILLGKKSMMDRDDYAYKTLGTEGKFCGMREIPSPIILIKDLELVKKVMIKDFDHFVDRRDFFYIDRESIVMGNALGTLKGAKWHGIRTSISPTFTTGKMRRMMQHFNSVSQELVNVLKKTGSGKRQDVVINVLNTANQYIVEVVATSVFGIRTGTIGNPKTEFCRHASRISELSTIDALKLQLSPRYPSIFEFFRISVFDLKALDFFENILRQGLEARKSGVIKKTNDFQQILIDRQKEEEMEGKGEKWLTDDVIVANSVLFFVAGSQATSVFISFSLWILAAHPEIQDRLREEVNGIMKRNADGEFQLDYDQLSELSYLEMFTSEVLRHYPAANRLEREATKDWHDKESGLFVPKGTTVITPVHAIHHDPAYYPNPETFNPENFSAKNKAKRSIYAYLPFGIGPRFCIGQRFALMEGKALIAHLVKHFIISPSDKTPLPVKGFSTGLQCFPPKSLELKLTAIQL